MVPWKEGEGLITLPKQAVVVTHGTEGGSLLSERNYPVEALFSVRLKGGAACGDDGRSCGRSS